MASAASSQGKVRFTLYQDAMNQQRLVRFMKRLARASERKAFLFAGLPLLSALINEG